MTSTERPGNSVYALLSDGTTVRIRPACPEDRERVLRLFTGMSPENLRLRFFTAGPGSAEAAAERISSPGAPGDHALLALVGDEVTGTAEFHRSPPTGRRRTSGSRSPTPGTAAASGPYCWSIWCTPPALPASAGSPPTP